MASEQTQRSLPKIKIFSSAKVSTLNLIVILCVLLQSCVSNDDYLNCVKDGKFLACHSEPQIMDFTNHNNFTIKVDPSRYTCGTPESSYFRLGESPARLMTCDAESQTDSHPASAMVDKDDATHTSTWWQSITWPLNETSFEIDITMSFNKMFRMTGDMEIYFHSGRPRKMILEKSVDYGETWTPLQYYSRNCGEYTSKGVKETVSAAKPDEVICTTQYSKNIFNPQPGAKVVFAAYYDRYRLIFPPDQNYSVYYNAIEGTNLLSFLSFTNLRIRLLYTATDAKESSRQLYDFLHYYYAISDIVMEARCFCNLHANKCIFKDGESYCDCQHFTEGRDCERCQPLYNNKPWQPATYAPYPEGKSNPCEKCECFDHAESCVYNETVKQGICVDCKHNTTGYRCDECLAGFFPDVELPLNHTDKCIECSCEPLGVIDVNSSCIQVADVKGGQPGQCKCKSLVRGRRCDECDPEYYGLLMEENTGTCKMCNCDIDGTTDKSNVCGQSDGQCICKPSTGGRRCDVCKDGYFEFPRGDPSKGCLSCGCDPGLSTSMKCDKSSGICSCKDHVKGTKCTDIDSNFYVPALDEFVLQPATDSLGDCKPGEDLWTEDKPFDGNKFAVCLLGKDTTLAFDQIVGAQKQKDVEWSYYPAIRYSLESTKPVTDIQFILTVDGTSGKDVSAMQTQNNISVDNTCNLQNGQVANISLTIPQGLSTGSLSFNETIMLDLRCKYTVSIKYSGDENATESLIVDSALLIPTLAVMNGTTVVSSFRVYDESANTEELQTSYESCVGKVVGLLTRDSALHKQPCMNLLRAVGGDLNKETIICGCDPVGTVVNTVCDRVGGQCQCKPGIGGIKCDRCHSGFYNFTGDGCQPCECGAGSLNGACNKATGQCPCKVNVAMLDQNDTTGNFSSRHCGSCLQNFYGLTLDSGCLACECSEVGSTDKQCAPNGQCPCKTTIGGTKCDICQPGYFKLSTDGCITCNCSSEGSKAGECDITSGECKCKDNVQGGKCDECKPNFFNLVKKNPRGCQPCFCFKHGSVCTSASGYSAQELKVTGSESLVPVNGLYRAPASFLGHRHWSYGQKLTFSIRSTGGDIDLKDESLIRFENQDMSITYYHKESVIINQTAMIFTVPMYEWSWTYNSSQATPEQFFRVLFDVSNIYISENINGTKLSISELVLVTAQKIDGTGDVTFVEQCTCSKTDFVSGTSCEKCTEGYRRPNLQNDTSYSVCVACDCNKRGATTPPSCDETSGVCLNCKNGTTGDHCESCAANVLAPACTECQLNFFGLDTAGCKACDCDAVGATSKDCNKETGQCKCAPHVTGRQCNQCEDNYYDIQSTGCKVCSDCYSLVMNEVQTLRSQRDNLTEELDRLRSNDKNAELGSFESRLIQSKTDMTKLSTYLNEADSVETDTRTKLDTFRNHIKEATDKTNQVKTESKSEIENKLLEGDKLLQQTLDNKQRVDITIKDIKALADPISATVAKLVSLAESIESAENHLVGISSNSSSGLTSILETIENLENISKTANTEATNSLEAVQAALTTHQNNTRKVSALQSQNELLKSTGETAIAEAREAQTTSNTTYNTAVKLTTELTDIQNYNPDIATTAAKIVSIKQQSEALKVEVTSEQSNIDTKIEAIASAATLGTSLLEEAKALLKSVDEMFTKASNALKVANGAKASETKVFQEAENMLATMKNFDARRQTVETTANASLDAVNEVKRVSEEVINEASSLTTALGTAQQNSALSKEAALQALNMAKQQNSALKPVTDSASEVLKTADEQLNDLQSKANAPKTTNTSVVQPLATTCDGFQASLKNLQTRATSANGKAQNLTTIVRATKDRANKLLADVNSIGDIDFTADTERLTRLKTDVQAASQALLAMNLTTTLTNLKNAIDADKIWLQNFRNEKTTLENQISYLKKLQQQVR